MESPDPQWTINSSVLSGIVAAAEVLGAPTLELLKQVGLEPETLADPEARHPVDALGQFYRLAADACNNADLGIYAGRIQYLNRLNLQLYTCSLCECFRDYLNLMPSVLRFAGDIGEVKVCTERDFIRMDWQPLWLGSRHERFQSDEILTAAAMIVGSLCVQTIPVRRAHFTYSPPQDLQKLQEVFGSELYFNQAASSLYFDRASLDFSLIKADAAWSRGLGQSVSHWFDRREDAFITELRTALLKLLPQAEVSIDRLAQVQGISRRTLQRRLAERGTQFAQLLQELREELARHYLSDQRLSMTDIAFLLGYSDQASFSAAFKHWCGLSPREYRNSF